MKNEFDYYRYLDEHPFTGIRMTDFYARLSIADCLRGHYDGTPGYNQIHGATPREIYHITEVEGYGDVADFCFVDDNGNMANLGNCFFERP